MGRSQAIQSLSDTQHDPRDPDPWYALYVDSSIPLATDAKAAFFARRLLAVTPVPAAVCPPRLAIDDDPADHPQDDRSTHGRLRVPALADLLVKLKRRSNPVTVRT
jgi:hypothetical protein